MGARIESFHLIERLGVSSLFRQNLDDVESVLRLDQIGNVPGCKEKATFSNSGTV